MSSLQDLRYQMALCDVPQIGTTQAGILMEHFQTAEAVFKAKKRHLEKLEGIGEFRAASIKSFSDFDKYEDEILFVEKYHIQTIFLSDASYPPKLRQCYDPPTLMFYKGNIPLQASKTIAVIGTRHHTDYGRQMTEQLIEDIAPYQPLIISGLAAGIDAIAHKTSMKHHISTIGVLAHGLDTIYPSYHKSLAKEMIQNKGGLLTEFKSGTKPDKHNFPTRNRIVAGMADATVVIETAVKGGSMITARLAFDYHRDVFAFPGKVTDHKSSGCNQLIKEQKAQLINNGKELAELMGWDMQPTRKCIQKKIFEELEPNENKVIESLYQSDEMHIDQLQFITCLTGSTLAATLLQLELKGIIRQLPGKIFTLT